MLEKFALVELNKSDVYSKIQDNYHIWQQYDNTGIQNLGIYDLFNSSRADLSGMANDYLYVSDISHDAFVNVDEIGTEAVAITLFATAVSGSPISLDPVIFRADHPFIFAIWDDETNVILFMGKMSIHVKLL